MREREELKKAIEQTDRLLSRVRQLEGENAELCKEKNEAFVRMRAVSSLGLFQRNVLLFGVYPLAARLCFGLSRVFIAFEVASRWWHSY